MTKIDLTGESFEPIVRSQWDVLEPVYVKSDGPGISVLVIGSLEIRLTDEQEEKVRFFYENT